VKVAALAAALCATALVGTPLEAGAAAAGHPRRPHGPFATKAMRTFLRARSGDITAAVYNLRTRRLFLYRPDLAEDEASIAKVDILATLLHDETQAGGSLSSLDRELAVGAIEDSDNDDAQQLWDAVGGNAPIAAFDAAAEMTQTTLDSAGEWGHYTTTARDQVRLLKQLVLPNRLLDATARSYELGLMHEVTASQAWGVSAGVLPPASVALKNGWLAPDNEPGWQINSIGVVSGRYRDYLIAVLTEADPSMAYGVDTIDGISRLVWSYFLPTRFRPRAATA
jgi:beta-lactamase class A